MRKLSISFTLAILLSAVVCTQSPDGQTLRLHPDKSPLVFPQDVFYGRILPSLKGKRVMLVTNPSGIGIHPEKIKKEFAVNSVTISHLIGLEHGFLGLEEEFSKSPVTTDSTFDLPIYHIYKLKEQEIAQLVSETDVILFDVQGMGMRVYTYLTVLRRLMDSVGTSRVRFYILDQIPPVLGLGAKGDFVDKGFANFAGDFPSPVILGMTLGEAALYYNGEHLKNRVSLEVIPVGGYKRGQSLEEVGIPWHTPSPNLPTLENARNYHSLVFLEGVNVSVGRGTQAPFIYIGAPWMQEPERLAKAMDSVSKQQYYFTTVYFKPTFGPHTGKICKGLKMHLVDPNYDPIETAYHLIGNMRKIYPNEFQWTKWSKIPSIDYLWGSPRFRNAIDQSLSYEKFYEGFSAKEKEFNQKIKKYWLYK